jgi:hypothetical protein
VAQNDDLAFATYEGFTDIHANGCWLECDVAGADRMLLRFEDVTGINHISLVGRYTDKEVYNMAGQCIGDPQTGLNIVDNKKVLVR